MPGRPNTSDEPRTPNASGFPGFTATPQKTSLVGTLLFVRPALLARQGAANPQPWYLDGRLSATVRRNPQRDEYVRARRLASTDGARLEPVTGQESHMIVRAASADALVHIPRGDGEIVADGHVRFLPLD